MSKKIKLKQEPKPEKVKGSYDEKSPITGNFTVMVENITNEGLPPDSKLPATDIYKICMETGYQTYWDTWKVDNTEFIENLETQMPEWIKGYKYVDSYKRVWYPMLAISYIATIHPYPESDGQLGWAVSTISPVTEESQLQTNQILKLPIETSDGPKLGLYKVDSESTQKWKFNEFEIAFDYYQNIVSENTKANNEA